jgi:hypothetical protein
MWNPEAVQQALHASGIPTALRWDAGETAHGARSLEHFKAQTFDVVYNKLRTLEFLPVDTSVPLGARSVTYEQWDQAEAARLIHHGADDLPTVNVFSREFTSPIKPYGSSYIITMEDMERATMAGSNFEDRLTAAARSSLERRLDQVAATGDVAAGLTGMLNAPGVAVFTFPTAGAWTGLTPAQVLNNMNQQVQAVVDANDENFIPDTMILGPVEYGHVINTPFFGGDGTDTILTVFLRNQPYVNRVERWTRADTAGAGGVARSVVYQRSPEVLTLNLPLPFQQLPPQPRNLALQVPVRMKVGSVEVHYPVAMNYGDVV